LAWSKSTTAARLNDRKIRNPITAPSTGPLAFRPLLRNLISPKAAAITAKDSEADGCAIPQWTAFTANENRECLSQRNIKKVVCFFLEYLYNRTLQARDPRRNSSLLQGFVHHFDGDHLEGYDNV
jgi:hypothetical protein